MECNRCCVQPLLHAFTVANLDNPLGRMKTKELVLAVRNLQTMFGQVCESCKKGSSKTNKAIASLKAAWNDNIQNLLDSVKEEDKETNSKIENLRAAFQTVCLTCSRISNDDNPSNHGQVFVSLDSGNCQANSGAAKNSATDDNVVVSRADWIGLHRAQDYEQSGYGSDPAKEVIQKEEPGLVKDRHSVTVLPTEIEDRLRQEFAKFLSLDVIDKMLVCCIMSGMNLAEFAKMLWFPYSIVDPNTRKIKPITKQAVHARWANITSKHPVFLSIAASSMGSRRRRDDFVRNPNADMPNNQFKNGKRRLPKGMAAAIEFRQPPAIEMERQPVMETKPAQRKNFEKEVFTKMLKKATIAKTFPTEAECLPGLF